MKLTLGKSAGAGLFLIVSVMTSAADKKLGTSDMTKPGTLHQTTAPKPIEVSDTSRVSEVKLTEECSVEIVRGGRVVGSVKLPPGTRVTVVRVESNQLWIAHGTATNTVPVTATDYQSQLDAIQAKALAEQGRRDQIASERNAAERIEARKKEWFDRHSLYFGEVKQVVADGLLVKVDGIGTVLLVGSSKQNEHVDGDAIKFYAEKIGRYQYTSVMGSTKTIDKWKMVNVPDFGSGR